MLELTKEVVSSAERLSTRKIYLFTNSRLFCVEGNWEWDFQASEVFCSDVFFPNNQEFEGTASLIHPKDNTSVREWVLHLEKETVQNFSFQIITSYGKVESLKVKGLVRVSEDKEFFSAFRQRQLDLFIRNKQLKERSEWEQLFLRSYELIEKVCDTGMWVMNSTTNETFYSDSVYYIHGLAPQSLNAHYYTFIPFIHPEDATAFISAFESAYKARRPLHLEYRLLLNRTEIKYVRLTTQWSHSYKGEEILTGIIEDLTLQKDSETKLLDAADELKLGDKMLRQAEIMGREGSWHMNLLTKKIVYSQNIYRLYGLKPTGQPLNPYILLNYVHPDDRDKVETANSKITEEHLETDIEFRIIKPNGKLRYLAQKSRILTNAANEVIVIGTVTDVSASASSDKKLKKIQAEQELQRIAFEQMQKVTHSGSWFRDLESGEETWSKGLYELLGLKQGAFQLSQKLFIHLVHPEDRKLFTSHLNVVMNGDKPETEFDFRVLRKGEIRHLHAQLAVLKKDERLLFTGTVQDRTEERYLQQQLSEQVRMTDMLSDASMNKLFVCDRNNNIIRWNKRCEETYGLKKEKLLGKNFFDVFPQLKTTVILEHFDRVSRGETVQIKDQKAILTGGHEDVLMVPVKDENGKIIATLTVIDDTTKEFELRQQLTERLRFIEKLLEESVDRVMVLDHHMNYLYWNRRAEEYYDIKKEKVLGKNILEVFPAFIDDPSYSQFRQALRGETVFISDSENYGTTKDHFETYLIPIKDDKGIVTGVLWIVHDLTKDRQLQQQQIETDNIIDALSEGYYKLDKEFRVKYMNPSAEKFFNSSKEDFIGRIIWDAVPGSVGGPIYKALTKAMEDKESIRDEYYFMAARKWVFLSVTPTVDGLSVMFFDMQKQKDDAHFIELTVDTSPNMIGVFSLREGKWIYINKAIEEFFGYTNEEMNEMRNDALAGLVHADDVAVVDELYRKIVSNQPGMINEAQYRALRKDGEYRWLFNRSTVFKTDEEGQPIEILSIAYDNTEKVQADEKLKENKDWLRSVLDNAGNSIMALKPIRNETGRIADLEYLFVNDKAAASVNRWDLVGKRMAEEFPGARSSGLFGHYIKVIETGEPWSDEVLINYDGFEIWAHASCSKFGEGCLVTYEDITERKKRELELKETKDLMQSLSDASIDRVMAYDREFKLVSWNRRCEEIYGLKKEKVLGKSIFDFYPKLKEDPTIINAIMQALKGKSIHLSMRRELYSNRMSEMFYIPVKDPEEEVNFVLIIVHDITKMYEAQEELKLLNRVLAEKNKLLEEKHVEMMNFSFVASHDLMEPVRKGTLFTNLLQEKESAKFSPAARGYVQKISNSMKRMNTLVEDILLLTELNSEKRKKEPVQLSALLEQVRIEKRDIIVNSGAEIEAEELPVIEGNRNQLLALFKNLIDNAIKFQKAGITPKIKITAELMTAQDILELQAGDDKEYAKISFADNGIGIDPKYFKKIFVIFQRLHYSNESEGTGIGLAICKKIMENHGGFITVQSEPGKGSVFSCYFLLHELSEQYSTGIKN